MTPQMRKRFFYNIVGYGAASIELLPAAFSAARVQKEDIHIRNTPGGTGSVEHMLHTVPVPDFTVEKDKKRRIGAWVSYSSQQILVSIRSTHPVRFRKAVEFLLGEQKLMNRRIGKLNHAHTTANTVADGLRVKRVAFTRIESGAQCHLIVLPQPDRAFPWQCGNKVIGSPPVGAHLEAQLPPIGAWNTFHQRQRQVFLICQSIDKNENLLCRGMLIQECDNAFVLIRCSVVIVSLLDKWSPIRYDLCDAGVKFLRVHGFVYDACHKRAGYARGRCWARGFRRHRTRHDL